MAIPEFVLQSFLDQILGFFAEKGSGLIRDALTKRKIQEAIKDAAHRFENEYPNRELAKTLSGNTRFYDLESVRASIRYLLEHPFDPSPIVQIESQFKSVLPKGDYHEVDIAAGFFVERLQEELMSVEKLQTILSLIYEKRTAEATERTANGVEKLVAKRRISPYEIDKAKQKYLQYIIDTNQYIDPRGIMQTRRSVALKLDEIYVTLSAERENHSLDKDKIRERKTNSFSDLDNVDDFDDKEDLYKEFGESLPSRAAIVELAKVIRENPRVVILGEPGAGKTTLVRFLALRFATTIRERRLLVLDVENNDYGAVRFPILLRIANYADAFSKNRSLKLREFIFENCDGGDVDKAILQEIFSQTMGDGNALILLDGLDEIVNQSDRAEIGRQIEKFVSGCNSETRVVITSRVAGYQPLAREDFAKATFVLREMDRQQIEKFLNNWCPAAEKMQTLNAPQSEIDKRSSREIEGVLLAVDENIGVRRLASNPLMLTILALIHRAGARLPSRRIELYELAVKTLLEDWELARGIPEKKIVKEGEALRMLGPLAYWLHQNKPSGIASEREVKDQLTKILSTTRNLPPENEEVEASIEDFLRRVREHTGLFVERAAKQYGFMHLTFEEYFSAREMIRRRSDAPKNIYEHRHRARWEEPILLASFWCKRSTVAH